MRRHRVLPFVLASAIGLTACGGQADTTAPTEATSPTSTPTAAPDTASPTATPTPAPGGTATEPSGPDTAATGDCSAAGMSAEGATLADLPADARATAELLLDAAVRCDEQLLATAAFESDTQLTLAGADPYAFFGLPEGEEELYATIATLLGALPHAARADDATPATFVWPRVHTGDWADSDEAWQEVVDAGLLTAVEAEEMRAAGAGYLGWRLGISGDGSWQFLVAGD